MSLSVPISVLNIGGLGTGFDPFLSEPQDLGKRLCKVTFFWCISILVYSQHLEVTQQLGLRVFSLFHIFLHHFILICNKMMQKEEKPVNELHSSMREIYNAHLTY